MRRNGGVLALRKLFPLCFAAAAAFLLAGCVDTPIIGDDIRVVRDSPHYLNAAYIYEGRNAVADADENFRIGNHHIYGVIGFGAAYPGLGGGGGGRGGAPPARPPGPTLLTGTAGAIETDAQHYYRRLAYDYAANYNVEMARLLGYDPTRP